MKKFNRVFVIMILALLFISPGIFAYLFYNHPAWLKGSATNQGYLLSPPVLLSELKSTKNWNILLRQTDQCSNDTQCLNTLDRLARIRLALGRHLYEVNVVLFIDKKITLSFDLSKLLAENDIKVVQTRHNDQLASWSSGTVFLVDTEGYAILSYNSPAPAEAIFHDLKHLITQGKNS